MRTCPITYRPLEPDEPGPYSAAGLHRLSTRLTGLADLEWSAEEQRREARRRADKLSIGGIQPKLSARLEPSRQRFRIVDRLGHWILKPQVELWEQLPENEDLTMHLAAAAGIETPVHGLVRSRDLTWTYFVRRFDRRGRRGRLAVEDFGQLSGAPRDVKYRSSMERLAAVLDRHVTFPQAQRAELLRRVLFCFLTGNEDMHLKNFSLITRGHVVELAPAYDLVNSTLALERAPEEIALPLNGKKRNLTRADLLDHYASERLRLNGRVVGSILEQLRAALPGWRELLASSFLRAEAVERYGAILDERTARLWP
jgi:serine/threonine-protein kinase HipA